MVKPSQTGRRPSRDGYTLVALVVVMAVLSIATAIMLPLWSSVIQREKERQLIFRGSQYAEAIRVFQARFGRLPVKLDELLKVEPRSIRQLWDDPMTENGRWDLIRKVGQGGTPGQGGAAGSPLGTGAAGSTGGAGPAGDLFGQAAGGSGLSADLFSAGGTGPGGSGSSGGSGGGVLGTGDGEEVNIGPIAGVRSRSDDSGFRLFLDREQYSRWEFTPDLFPPVVGTDGKPKTPHLGTDWIGRPPPNQKPKGGGTPEDLFREALEGLGEEDTP